MTERERADIEIRLGSSLITTVPITAESRRVRKLMESDYIRLEFKTDEPVEFPLGAFVNDEIFGKFYITDEQAPSFNQALHGYDYKLQFNAHYYRWQKQFFCMLRTLGDTEVRSEKMWTLTTSLRNQMREFMVNLQILGYVDSSYNFRANDIALNTFVVIDESVETQMQSLTMSYSSTYMLDALKTMADTWGCEYWIEGDETNFKIHFGTCEYGTTEQIISLDSFTEDGEEVPATAETMSFDKDMSDGSANLLYYFGGTQNIPNTYRKELRLKAGDVDRDVNNHIRLNGYKSFGGTDEKLDLRNYINNPPDNLHEDDPQNKFTVSIGSGALGSGTYRSTRTPITGDKLIANNFFSANIDKVGSTLRRFYGVRVCNGCKVNINGKREVVRVLSQADITYIRQGTIEELRVLADLIIYEYKSNGDWVEADRVPLPLTYEQWYGLIVKTNSPLSEYLIYPVGIPYADNTTLKYRGWLTLNNIALDVNIPLVNGSRLEYSSYLKNEDSISDYLNNYEIVNAVFDDVDFFTFTAGTAKVFSFDNILPRSGKFNPNRSANINIIFTFMARDGNTYECSSDDMYSRLQPSNVMPGTNVIVSVRSNIPLNRMEWNKVFDDTNTLYRSNGGYYISLFKYEPFYPTSFDMDMELTPQDIEFEGFRELSGSVVWDEEDYFNSLNYDIAGINRINRSVALSDTVWVTKDASDTSITTKYKYYENANFNNVNGVLIDTIDISDGSGDQRNLTAHTHNQGDSNFGNTLGFCPDAEIFSLYDRLDLTVPEQDLLFQVPLLWGANSFDHAVVRLEMKIVFAGVDNGDYSCINSYYRGYGDNMGLYAESEKVTVIPDSGGATVSLPVHLPYTKYTFDNADFWDRINNEGKGFLPYVVARANVTYYDSQGNKIISQGYTIGDVELTNIEDFVFYIDFYAAKIQAHITAETEGGVDQPRQIFIENTNIPQNALVNGTEFVIHSDYDNRVPYKWYVGAIDDPSSLLSIGDMHLQLPIIDEDKFEANKTKGMHLYRSGGETCIIWSDTYKPTEDIYAQAGKIYYADANGTELQSQPVEGENIASAGYYELVYDDDTPAYKDGCIFLFGMIVNPDKYFPSEKCVINENIYPMAMCLIMRQNNTYDPNANPPVYPKGIFTEDKTEYVDVEGEDASNRLSYPWQQYHVNIGTPTIEGDTTTIAELQFSKDYVLQNSQPLKMRFLVPNDVKDLVASDVMSLLEDNAHCKLAGMTFEVAFNAQTSYKHSGSATATVHTLDYAIARNEDFGAKLPSDVLCPSNLDPCVLENWNVKALSAMGLMDKAEYRLLDKAFEYYKAMHDNNLTVTADMMSDWMFLMTGRYDTLVEADDKILVESQDKVLKARGGMEEYSIPDIGMKVCVKHASLKNGEKHTRVLGYEMKLDKPYDTPKLIMGESEATSRLKILEKEITKLS